MPYQGVLMELSTGSEIEQRKHSRREIERGRDLREREREKGEKIRVISFIHSLINPKYIDTFI